MSDTIIQLNDVHKSFGKQKVLEGINLKIPRGKTTVIAGASGQGKSVIVKLILGLLKPDSGEILVEGRDITKLRQKELNKVRMEYGVLFQGAALLDSLSVFDNVALPLQERTRLGKDEIKQKVYDSLKELGLAGHENKFPAQLSGGMKKRVGLARALQLHPKIMFFDEPTTGLDPEKSLEIYQLFHRTQKQFGYTSIIVSHDIPKIFNLSDQVVILEKGHLAVFTNPEDIQLSEDPVIKSFVATTMGNIYESHRLE